MKGYWQWLSLVALCGVLAISYSVLTDRSGGNTATAQAEQQGYYVRQATIIETSDMGRAQWTLHAETITQNLRDDSIALQGVRVDYMPQPDRHWLLTADGGHIPPASRVIEFRGNVLVQPADDARALALRTASLRIDTEHSIASTAADVVIEMNQQRLNARGLRADLKRDSLRLESRVHGRFDAP